MTLYGLHRIFETLCSVMCFGREGWGEGGWTTNMWQLAFSSMIKMVHANDSHMCILLLPNSIWSNYQILVAQFCSNHHWVVSWKTHNWFQKYFLPLREVSWNFMNRSRTLLNSQFLRFQLICHASDRDPSLYSTLWVPKGLPGTVYGTRPNHVMNRETSNPLGAFEKRWLGSRETFSFNILGTRTFYNEELPKKEEFIRQKDTKKYESGEDKRDESFHEEKIS